MTHSLLATALSIGLFHTNTVSAQTYAFDGLEGSFDAAYAATPITLTGAVVTEAGLPLANATVRVLAWGAGAGNLNRTATTNAAGRFTLTGLKRRNVLLTVGMASRYTEIVPVDLQQPLGVTTTTAGTIALNKISPGQARIILGGDTMIGRRFVDADGDGIEGEPGDLVRPTSRAADTKALLAYLHDQLTAADYTVVNLESAIAPGPIPSNCGKGITFFSYPETLLGLKWAGIDGVSLGNNHVFDQLGPGVSSTLTNLAVAGLDAAGAGMNETAALGSTIARVRNNVPLAMLGFDQIVTAGSLDPNCLLVARNPAKAGALEASMANIGSFLQGSAARRFAIPMIHGGTEYSSYPTDKMRQLFLAGVKGGAGLVVGHHPHTTHGIGVAADAAGAPRFVLLSLGNLLFDQQIFETFQSYIVIADVKGQPGGGYLIPQLELVPLHHEGYIPKLLTGEALYRSGRDIGHLSTTLPLAPTGATAPDGLRGAVVFPTGHRVFAFHSASQYSTSRKAETLSLAVSPLSHTTATGEFRRTMPAESLASVQSDAAAIAEYGRDILKYGDFEDNDVDGAYSEGTSWDQSPARYVENSIVRSGTGALVLLRKSSDLSYSASFNQQRLTIPGGTRLTFRGYVRGDNSGIFKVTVRYYDANDVVISAIDLYTRNAGTYGWTPFEVTQTAPTNAKKLRIWFKQSPPAAGEGRTFVDDCAIVRWEGQNANALAGFSLPTPNNWSYFRFANVDAAATRLTVTLGHQTYVPR